MSRVSNVEFDWNSRKKIGDLTGKRFGNWLVVSKDLEKKSFFNVICDCGDAHSISSRNLSSGRSTMCAKCRHKERREKTRRYFDLKGLNGTK